MSAQLIKINAVMFLLFLEVISVNIIGNFTSRSATKTAAVADDIVGQWVDEDKTRRIKIEKSGSIYEGVITAAPKTELVGKKLLNNMVYSNGEYTGKIYLPKRDTYYNCTAKLKDNNSLMIEGSAGILSKETVWTRVK